MDLLKRRSEIAARAKVLVSVSGSGRHKSDPQEAERLARGEPPLTEKLIGLKDDDRVYLVGECVDRAMTALQSYVEADRDRGDDERTPVERHALRVAKRAVPDPSGFLCLPTQDWNGLLFAIAQFGLHCVLGDARHTPEEER